MKRVGNRSKDIETPREGKREEEGERKRERGRERQRDRERERLTYISMGLRNGNVFVFLTFIVDFNKKIFLIYGQLIHNDQSFLPSCLVIMSRFHIYISDMG